MKVVGSLIDREIEDESQSVPARSSAAGFTLLELLTVIGIVMILAAMLFPALYQVKEKARTLHCVNNLKQLTHAWVLYALDHEDRLLPNSPYRPNQRWMAGNFRLGARNNPDHIDPQTLETSMLARHLIGTQAYKCPSDSTRNLQMVAGREKLMPWNRSVALNQWMAGIENKTYRTYRRLSQIDAPSERFTFANQRPDTLENAYFMTGAVGLFEPERLRWIEFPARYHNGATPLSFADGHVQIKRWATEWPEQARKYDPPKTGTPFNPDVLWLNRHATSVK